MLPQFYTTLPSNYCKEHYHEDASQEKQTEEAPRLVRSFLSEANYPPPYVPRIIELVERHHDYDCPRDPALHLLIEADLIVNCYENDPSSEEMLQIQAAFQSPLGEE